MKLFDFYLFKNIAIASVFIAFTLAAVIFLTQSLRFLELVIESGASSTTFWILTVLALPRFFEVILPLSVMAATIFIYNRMTMDSELIAIRATGQSPLCLSRAPLLFSVLVAILLMGMTMYVAPKALDTMQKMRHVIKAQFSTSLFREGVFNQFGAGLTVYIRDKTREGELRGLIIHDSRESNEQPATVLAKHGQIIATDDGNQVVVFDGSRQSYNADDNILQKLDFDRYTIDLPSGGPVRDRWREPDERTILELLNPDPSNARDVESERDFFVEIHRRITSPLLVIGFTAIALSMLLIGPVDRRGQSKRIALTIVSVVVIQGLFIVAYNLSRNSDVGLVFMYLLSFLPIGVSLFALSPYSETMRRNLFYKGGA